MGLDRALARIGCSACSAVALCMATRTFLGRTQDIDSEVAPYRSARNGIPYHVYHSSPLSGRSEHIMSTHASPDDVSFTKADLTPILEGRSSVGGPRHLKDAGSPRPAPMELGLLRERPTPIAQRSKNRLY